MDTGGERGREAAGVRRIREHDERVLANQYPVYDDDAALLQTAQEARDDLMHLFEADVGEDAREEADGVR